MPLIPACPRVPVASCPARIPAHFVEALEQNQQIASCCRHPENHQIEAWYSSEEDAAKGIPDIYVFHCTCGRKHSRFCAGGAGTPPQGDFESAEDYAKRLAKGMRPIWEVR